jgi:hypothetical protein
MDDLMRILKELQSRYRWAVRQSLKLFGLEIKRSISDMVGMMEREM